MYSENLDSQLEDMEATGETEAELIDQQTELQDYEDDEDEIMGPDAQESDLEHAYASFSTQNEMNFNGWDSDEIEEAEDLYDSSNVLESQPDGFHLESDHDLEEQVVEMEIEEGDIYAFLVDEDDNEVGFVLLDEEGNQQEYYYVDDPDGATIDAEGTEPAHAVRESDSVEFDLGMTKEQVGEASPTTREIPID